MSLPPWGTTPSGVPLEVAYRLSNGLPIGGSMPPAPTAEDIAQREARRVAAEAQWATEHQAWVSACRAQLSHLEPYPRMASVMTVAASPGWPAHRELKVYPSLIALLAPELGVHCDEDLENPPWDDEGIAWWFAGAAREPAQRFEIEERRSMLGRWKRQSVEGWSFSNGSTMLWEHPGGDRWFLHRGVSCDGRPLYGNIGIGASLSFERRHPQDRFSGVTLQKMAGMAGLPPLPPAPLRPGT